MLRVGLHKPHGQRVGLHKPHGHTCLWPWPNHRLCVLPLQEGLFAARGDGGTAPSSRSVSDAASHQGAAELNSELDDFFGAQYVAQLREPGQQPQQPQQPHDPRPAPLKLRPAAGPLPERGAAGPPRLTHVDTAGRAAMVRKVAIWLTASRPYLSLT